MSYSIRGSDRSSISSSSSASLPARFSLTESLPTVCLFSAASSTLLFSSNSLSSSLSGFESCCSANVEKRISSNICNEIADENCKTCIVHKSSKPAITNCEFVIKSSYDATSSSVFVPDRCLLETSIMSSECCYNRQFEKNFDDNASITSLSSTSSTEEEINSSETMSNNNTNYRLVNNSKEFMFSSKSMIKKKQIYQRTKLRNEVGKVLGKSSFLTTRDGNRQLMKSVLKDRRILNYLLADDTQTLNQSCELGKSLSFLVQDKAKKLNSSTYPLILSNIIEHYHNTCYIEETYQKDSLKSLDFVKLSQIYGNFIHTNCLAINSFEWSSFSLQKLDDNERNTKRKRIGKRRNLIEPYTKLTETEGETDKIDEQFDSLTSRQANEMHEKLRILTKQFPINFWKFIVDTDEIEGFQNSCRNIFLMTLIARRGMVRFSVGSSKIFSNKRHNKDHNSDNNNKLNSYKNVYIEGILLVQAVHTNAKTSNENCSSFPSASSYSLSFDSSSDENFVQAEAILSGWSFDIWIAFCNCLKLRN